MLWLCAATVKEEDEEKAEGTDRQVGNSKYLDSKEL